MRSSLQLLASWPFLRHHNLLLGLLATHCPSGGLVCGGLATLLQDGKSDKLKRQVRRGRRYLKPNRVLSWLFSETLSEAVLPLI